MKQFEIPIAVFMFKRADKTALIIDQIAKVSPTKIYLIGDGPRNEDEVREVDNCRKLVESRINWNCSIIRNYAEKNRGVYENIAGGAKWVFERESKAIFLEDDNFPAISFFEYCKELLEKYNDDNRVLWICGTNYQHKCEPKDGSDYFFTQLMLPCGWASWSNKFLKFYDGEIKLYRDDYVRSQIRFQYRNKLLYIHDYPKWNEILEDLDANRKPVSWDYQMAFALRVNNLFGISPKYNLIQNVGADSFSIHGGNSMNKVMTRRFCEVPIHELKFPLKHPKCLLVDSDYEQSTEKIIVAPFRLRMYGKIVLIIKKIFKLNRNQSLKAFLKLK